MTAPGPANGAVHTHPRPVDDASLGQLTARMSEQVSRLVRDELALAQLEAAQKTKRLGLGLGMFGGSGLLAFFGTGVAITAGVPGLATEGAGWLAARRSDSSRARPTIRRQADEAGKSSGASA